MREELESTQRDLEASRSIRGELATKLANATTDLRLAKERLEAERVRADGLIKQIGEKEQAIANFQKELDKLKHSPAELAIKAKDRELAECKIEIKALTTENAKLEKQVSELAIEALATSVKMDRFVLAGMALDDQSPVISEEQPPAVNSEESEVSSQESEPDSKPKILKTSGMAAHINQNFKHEKPFTKQKLIDAARGASKTMPEYERLYGFKFLGKIKGEYAYEIQSQG